MNRPLSIFVVLAVLTIASITLAELAWADPKELIIRDVSGEIGLGPINITGSMLLTPEGNVELTSAEPLICETEPEFDCGDVTVGPLHFRFEGTDNTSLTVTEGEPVTLRWHSRGSWECQAEGLDGWENNALPPDSDRLAGTETSLRIIQTAGLASEDAYTLSLVCRNGPVESDEGVAQTLSLTVEEGFSPGPIEGCEERGPPRGWTRLSNGPLSCNYISGEGFDANSDCRFWQDTSDPEDPTKPGGIWPSPFLDTGGNTRRLAIGRESPEEYMAIEFNTVGLTPDRRGRITAESAGSGIVPTRVLATISTCPGDFNRDAILAETGCYQTFSSLTALRWGGAASGESCQLEPDTRYFLNLIPTDSPLGTATNSLESNCPEGSRCGSVVSPQNL